MVKFNDLGKQYELIKDAVQPRLEKLFKDSSYINGPDVELFEKNFARYIGTKYAVGVSNGTDAIELSVKAIKKQGRTLYLIPNNTFIATYLGIQQGDPYGQILTVDCDSYYQIDVEDLERMLKEWRSFYNNCVIVGVHLYGHCCDVKSIIELCHRYDCTFMEDASQSHGTVTEIWKTGAVGALSAFSFYPGKNLGACGDAGIITTNDKEIKDKLLRLRNFGTLTKCNYEIAGGTNHRLDSIQAIFLDEKLKYLDEWNADRQEIANIYSCIENVVLPRKADYCLYNTYHVYPIRVDSNKRDGLQRYLKSCGIETGIHYPETLEQIKMLNIRKGDKIKDSNQFSSQLLSLPIHPFMSASEAQTICGIINGYRI